MRVARSSFVRIIAVAAVVALAMSLTSCGLFKKVQPITVADPGGFFHFKIPGSWLAKPSPGAIQIYGSTTPPKTEKLEALTAVVFVRQVESKELNSDEYKKADIAKLLSTTVKSRAESRKWSSAKIGSPKKFKLGGRSGYMLEATATDAQGVKFSGAYYYVRTLDREIFIVSSAPVAQWAEASKQLNEVISNQWFWHVPLPKASTETTKTPTKKK